MPPSRRDSAAGNRPHSVSVKVLRLSRPSLAPSDNIGYANSDKRLERASLAYPSQPAVVFPLTPVLTLPPSFGAAYVGETFACTLCANNEVASRADQCGLVVKNVQIRAELQTPTSQPKGIDLEVEMAAKEDGRQQSERLDGNDLIQGIVRHDLKEEGTHVLAVTVTYSETTSVVAEGETDSTLRTRTFKKLYQFVAQQALGVRTKIGELPDNKNGFPSRAKRFVLEAQLENQTEQGVLLDKVGLNLARNLKCQALCGASGERAVAKKVMLAPQDVEQVAFILEQDGADLEQSAGSFVLAQMVVNWRVNMGQEGTLKTGWLGSRRR